MPFQSGLKTAEQVAKVSAATRIVLLGSPSLEDKCEIKSCPIVDALYTKPIQRLAILQIILEQLKIKREQISTAVDSTLSSKAQLIGNKTRPNSRQNPTMHVQDSPTAQISITKQEQPNSLPPKAKALSLPPVTNSEASSIQFLRRMTDQMISSGGMFSTMEFMPSHHGYHLEREREIRWANSSLKSKVSNQEAAVLSNSVEDSQGKLGMLPTSKTTAARRPISVLLIEDCRVSQRALVNLLSQWNINVTAAIDGWCGFQELRKRDFDLALLDLHNPNPVYDGFNLSKWLVNGKGTVLQNLVLLCGPFQLTKKRRRKDAV